MLSFQLPKMDSFCPTLPEISWLSSAIRDSLIGPNAVEVVLFFPTKLDLVSSKAANEVGRVLAAKQTSDAATDRWQKIETVTKLKLSLLNQPGRPTFKYLATHTLPLAANASALSHLCCRHHLLHTVWERAQNR